ncbi:replication endonuclease [Microvirga sp. 2TAF3]|uniref:replication endonuclease n=1 Tax=Microvirga sp. 2TAF3 TaxID=3233014 RepID=UPI003F9D69C3
MRLDLPANGEIDPWAAIPPLADVADRNSKASESLNELNKEWTGALADIVDLDNEADEEERLAVEADTARRRKEGLDWQPKGDALDLFRALPSPWQSMLLRRHGGTGAETADDLVLSLSEEPCVRQFSGNSWRHDAWTAVQKLRPIAEGVVAIIQSLMHVDQAALPLLSASDTDLLGIAEHEAEVATRTYIHRLRIAEARQRRAGLHRERLVDAVARGAGAEELARLHAAIDECLDAATAAERVKEARTRLEAARATGMPVSERRKLRKLLKLADQALDRALAAAPKESHPSERDAGSVRRRLRRRIGQAAVHAAGILQLIGGPKNEHLPSYVDQWTLHRWREKRASNRTFMSSRELLRTTEDGREVRIPLLEVIEGKREARRAMWYAMVLGMRDHARRVNAQIDRRVGDVNDKLVPLFITASLPPKWHLHPSHGRRTPDLSLSPKDGVRELGERWHRSLMLLRDKGIIPFGVKTYEPHTDGTGHLHAMLYARARDVAQIKRVFGMHWPATTKQEENRRAEGSFDGGPALKVKDWDGNGVADPTSYVMTYVLKGLDAEGDRSPDSDDDRVATEAAVAWASSLGVRRLSIVGLTRGIMGRWEDLFRYVRGEHVHECPRSRAVIRAMRKKQWATALALLGAFQDRSEAKRRPRLVAYHEIRENRWQEQVRLRAGWLHPRTDQVMAVRRPYAWAIVTIEETSDTGEREAGQSDVEALGNSGLSNVVSYPRGGSLASSSGGDPPRSMPSASPLAPPSGCPADDAISIDKIQSLGRLG